MRFKLTLRRFKGYEGAYEDEEGNEVDDGDVERELVLKRGWFATQEEATRQAKLWIEEEVEEMRDDHVLSEDEEWGTSGHSLEYDDSKWHVSSFRGLASAWFERTVTDEYPESPGSDPSDDISVIRPRADINEKTD